MEILAVIHLLTDITGSIEKANALSTNLAINTTLLEQLLFGCNKTSFMKNVVRENAAKIFASILDKAFTQLVAGGG